MIRLTPYTITIAIAKIQINFELWQKKQQKVINLSPSFYIFI